MPTEDQLHRVDPAAVKKVTSRSSLPSGQRSSYGHVCQPTPRCVDNQGDFHLDE